MADEPRSPKNQSAVPHVVRIKKREYFSSTTAAAAAADHMVHSNLRPGGRVRLVQEQARPVLRALGRHSFDKRQPKYALTVTLIDGPIAFLVLHSSEELALRAWAHTERPRNSMSCLGSGHVQ